jgi:hypothetical protein
MAWLACQQVEYVPEQLIRVPSAPEAPEITVFAVPASRICPAQAAGITTGSHAPGDTIGARNGGNVG